MGGRSNCSFLGEPLAHFADHRDHCYVKVLLPALIKRFSHLTRKNVLGSSDVGRHHCQALAEGIVLPSLSFCWGILCNVLRCWEVNKSVGNMLHL